MDNKPTLMALTAALAVPDIHNTIPSKKRQRAAIELHGGHHTARVRKWRSRNKAAAQARRRNRG